MRVDQFKILILLSQDHRFEYFQIKTMQQEECDQVVPLGKVREDDRMQLITLGYLYALKLHINRSYTRKFRF